MSKTEQDSETLDGRNASLEIVLTTLLTHLAETNTIDSQTIKRSLTEQRDAMLRLFSDSTYSQWYSKGFEDGINELIQNIPPNPR